MVIYVYIYLERRNYGEKRLISLLLCAAMMIVSVPQSVFAASSSLKTEEELAEDLKELGLFKGVSDAEFALNRAPTRTEALIMLIRVLGNVDLDVYPEDERALELLKMWIYNNQNKVMGYGPGFITVFEEDDVQQQLIIAYDELEHEIVSTYYEYGANNSYELSVQMRFGKWETVNVAFKIYQEIEELDPYMSSQDINDYGAGSTRKDSFADNFTVTLTEFYGDYLYKSDYEKITASVCEYMLGNIDLIFEEYLSGYDVDGVRALGFDDFYYE